MTTAPLITLDNVSRIFDDGSVVALAGIDMRIARGEFVSIVGPSGSGKSSLVHIMAGFDRPTGGRVLWQGREVQRPAGMDDAPAQQDRHRLPGIPAAADAERDRECRDRDERHRACRRRSAGSARPSCSIRSALAAASAICRLRCPAASASAWRSRAASPTGRSCCCRTSRPATSTAPMRRRSSSCCLRCAPRPA